MARSCASKTGTIPNGSCLGRPSMISLQATERSCGSMPGARPRTRCFRSAREGASWRLILDRAGGGDEAAGDTVEIPGRSVIVLAEKMKARQSSAPSDRLIGQLAEAAGIHPVWWTVAGERHDVGVETKRILLAAMGLDIASGRGVSDESRAAVEDRASGAGKQTLLSFAGSRRRQEDLRPCRASLCPARQKAFRPRQFYNLGRIRCRGARASALLSPASTRCIICFQPIAAGPAPISPPTGASSIRSISISMPSRAADRLTKRHARPSPRSAGSVMPTMNRPGR